MDGFDPDGPYPDEAFHLLDLAAADVLVVGHTHRAFAFHLPDGRRILNPAALLRDPGGDESHPGATGTFGVLELPSREFRLFSARGEERPLLRVPGV